MDNWKPIYLAIIFCSFSGYSQPNSPLVECWITSYEPTFDFIEQLNRLEQQLQEHGQLSGSSSADYQKLFEDMRLGTLDLSFDDIRVDQFVSEQPFKKCTSNNSFSNEDDRTVKYGVLFSMYVVLGREYAKIEVEITANSELTINGEVVAMTKFQTLASKAMDELEAQGIPREEIIYSLKVAENVKMGQVTNIQAQLRELSVKKVTYGN